MTLNPS